MWVDPDDDDVFEIPPPPHLPSSSTFKRKKQSTVHDVIDIDNDEDSDDVVITGEKQSKRNKGKAIAAIYDGYEDHQVMEVSDCQPGMEKFGPFRATEFSIYADGHGSDLKYGDDNNIHIVSDNFVEVDEYALLLQAHFDSVDIPTGIEAPINLLPEVLNKNGNSTFSPWSNMLSNAHIQGSTVDNVGHYSEIDLSPQAAPLSKKNSATSQKSGHDLNLSLGKESSKSKRSLRSFHGKMKSYASKNRGSVCNLEAMKLPHAARDGKALDLPVLAKSDDVSDGFMRKFRSFKQFDIVEDASDHSRFRAADSVHSGKPTEKWSEAIHKDWKILEKDLPDSIFVRVYESRMDLLRAVIVGPEGTPYHDGLFIFDVQFTCDYPSVPPVVLFRSGCVNRDMSLVLESGFPSLCILNSTWARNHTRVKWIPGVSTMLQVLVSIQGYFWNAESYFDDDGWAVLTKGLNRQISSLQYNENTFIQSLRLMLQTTLQPPMNFEDFVVGHFRSRGYDILMACKAYMEGVPVGFVVNGGVQDVYEANGSCSKKFKKSLAGMWEDCQRFFKGGATDYEKMLLTEKPKNDEILRKFRCFKQFDTVEDASDHAFVHHNSSVKQNPKKWAKKIQKDWKILEKCLPDSIFVRVYESRMDLLSAVIIGAEGTPYHDGLFFFDVHFPGSYPNEPPLVYFRRGGLDLCHSLAGAGICLSLLLRLPSWTLNKMPPGDRIEMWLPSVSTVLQLLVSIQGFVFTKEPMFNNVSAKSRAVKDENMSLKYNEDTFVLSMRLMIYMINRPPKHFEDFVVGHFCSRGHDILMACKAYMEGVKVGCVVKGGVQDVEESNRSCSQVFKNSLAPVFKEACQRFCKCGAKDCEKFLLTEKDKK